MSDEGKAFDELFYSLMALEQPIGLPELTEGAQTFSFPALATQTPEWFAAAADDTDLLAMAPELQVLPPDDGEVSQQAVDIDLIHVYAPEMAALEDDEDVEVAPPPVAQRPAPAGAAAQIGLLKELEDLDD